MNTRNFLVILIVILLIAALGLGVWNLFLKTPASSNNTDTKTGELPSSATTTREPARPTSTEATKTDSILPEPKKENGATENSSGLPSEEKTEEMQLKQLTEKQVLAPKITKDGNFIKYYQKKDGRVFRSSFNGEAREKISDTEIPNLEAVNWSPGGNQVITTWVNEDQRRHKTYYNYETGASTQLDPRMKKINWAPNNKTIFYHFIDKSGGSNLAVAEPDGSRWQAIESMSIDSTKLYWPRLDFLSIITPGGEFYPATVYKLPLGEGSEEEILEGVDLDSGLRWSRGSDMFLYKSDAEKPLSLYRLEEGSDNLKLPASVAKCSWARSDKSVYCAVSVQKIVDRELLSESYAEEFLPQSDSFWQIDLEEKKVRELYVPKSNQNVVNVKKDTLKVGPDENYLFWVDGGTNQLYRLKL